jgi:uncharacterized glyoxalase superfamily protein PhnB
MDEKTHPNIFPTLRYMNASGAIDWLGRAFGFEEKAVYRGEAGRTGRYVMPSSDSVRASSC